MSQKLEVIEYKTPGARHAFVLLHGYGANAQDLAPLHTFFKAPKKLDFFFPDAPHSPGPLAAFGGRAWFALDMMLLQRRAMDPEGILYDQAHVDKLQKSTDQVLKPFLDQLCEHYDGLILGGFSQGSMIGLDWAWRHSDPKLKALVFYSGAWPYVPTSSPSHACALSSHVPVFISHGKQDPVLRIRHSDLMRSQLEAQGIFVEHHEFNGGHEIPMTIIQSSSSFVNGILKNQNGIR